MSFLDLTKVNASPKITNDLNTLISKTNSSMNINGYLAHLSIDNSKKRIYARSGMVLKVSDGEGKLIEYNTPSTLLRSTEFEPSDYVTKIRSAQPLANWVQYEQYSPYRVLSGEDLLNPFTKGVLKAKISIKRSGQRQVYTARSNSTTWIFTVESKLITKIVRSGFAENNLTELTQFDPKSISVPNTKITYTINLYKPSHLVYPSSNVFVESKNPFVADKKVINKDFISSFARDLFIYSNDHAKIYKREVTVDDVSRELAKVDRSQFKNLKITIVGNSIEFNVRLQDSVENYCARMVKFDYTNESLLLEGDVC